MNANNSSEVLQNKCVLAKYWHSPVYSPNVSIVQMVVLETDKKRFVEPDGGFITKQ